MHHRYNSYYEKRFIIEMRDYEKQSCWETLTANPPNLERIEELVNIYDMKNLITMRTHIQEKYQSILCIQLGWYTSAEGAKVTNIDMLKLLMKQFAEDVVILDNTGSIMAPTHNELKVTAQYNKSTDLIHLEGMKLKYTTTDGSKSKFVDLQCYIRPQMEHYNIHRACGGVWFDFEGRRVEHNLPQMDFFKVSYDITAEGQIVNYVSKEKPDIAKDLGLTL